MKKKVVISTGKRVSAIKMAAVFGDTNPSLGQAGALTHAFNILPGSKIAVKNNGTCPDVILFEVLRTAKAGRGILLGRDLRSYSQAAPFHFFNSITPAIEGVPTT